MSKTHSISFNTFSVGFLLAIVFLSLSDIENQKLEIISDGRIDQTLEVNSSVNIADIERKVFDLYVDRGYLNVLVDSVNVTNEAFKAYISKGCRFRIESVTYILRHGDISTAGWNAVLVDIPSIKETYYSSNLIEQHGKGINILLEERGFLLSTVEILQPDIDQQNCTLNFTYTVDSGDRIRLGDHLFTGVERNDIDYLKRVTGIRSGDVLTPRMMRNARLNLENTDLFESVENPLLASQNDDFYLFHEVVERRANAFDLLFGYVPDQNGGNTIIGQGSLTIRNVLLSGSFLGIEFERLQLLTTKVNFDYSSRWILGTPFGAGVSFSFLQQDSTYTTRNFGMRGTYNLSATTEIIGTLRQESVSTNTLTQQTTGNQALDGDAFFGGVGIEYRLTDRRRNPTRGVEARILAESGFRNVTDVRIQDLDVTSRFAQQVFHGLFRAYINPLPRQVIAPSIHVNAIISGEYSRTDLIRFGGAKSLRGYNEDQFRANRVVWSDLEYRYLLDRFSYAFIFGALGYYERPRLILEQSNMLAVNQWLNSFGLGFAYNTPIGMIRFTYAISPDETISNGKVHFGLTANL